MCLFRGICMRNLREMQKKKPCKEQLSSKGPCWGMWREFVYWYFREKKRMHISVHFSWTQRKLKVVWRPSGTLARNRADIRLWETQGPFIRPRCIVTVRARTQMPINQSIIESSSHLVTRASCLAGNTWKSRGSGILANKDSFLIS